MGAGGFQRVESLVPAEGGGGGKMRTGGLSGGGYWSQRAGGRVQKRGWVIGGARVG